MCQHEFSSFLQEYALFIDLKKEFTKGFGKKLLLPSTRILTVVN